VPAVSLFYLLPPRPAVGDAFASLLQAFFPGVDWPARDRAPLADLLADLAEARPDVFVLFRDDLAPGTSVARALADGFGAEDGDEVVEVRPSGQAGALGARRWRLGGCPSPPD
jgi:hypothetical protein